MDLSEALHACRCGALIRDDAGTMKQKWKVKFVPDDTEKNKAFVVAKKPHLQEGKFIYVNPNGEDAHQLFFQTHHRASVGWRTVGPNEK